MMGGQIPSYLTLGADPLRSTRVRGIQAPPRERVNFRRRRCRTSFWGTWPLGLIRLGPPQRGSEPTVRPPWEDPPDEVLRWQAKPSMKACTSATGLVVVLRASNSGDRSGRAMWRMRLHTGPRRVLWRQADVENRHSVLLAVSAAAVRRTLWCDCTQATQIPGTSREAGGPAVVDALADGEGGDATGQSSLRRSDCPGESWRMGHVLAKSIPETDHIRALRYVMVVDGPDHGVCPIAM